MTSYFKSSAGGAASPTTHDHFYGPGSEGAVVWNAGDHLFDGPFYCTSLTINGAVRLNGKNPIFCTGTVTISPGAVVTLQPYDRGSTTWVPLRGTNGNSGGAGVGGAAQTYQDSSIYPYVFSTRDQAGRTGGSQSGGAPEDGYGTGDYCCGELGYGRPGAGGAGGAGTDGAGAVGGLDAKPDWTYLLIAPYGLPNSISDNWDPLTAGLGGAGGGAGNGDGGNFGGGGGAGGMGGCILNIVAKTIIHNGSIVAVGGDGGDGGSPGAGNAGGGGGGGGGAGGIIYLSTESFTGAGVLDVSGGLGGTGGTANGTGVNGSDGLPGDNGTVVILDLTDNTWTISH